MPLIRRDPSGPSGSVPPGEPAANPEAAPPSLADPDPERRRAAARALHDPAVLAGALETETVPAVREALLTGLLRLGAAPPLLPLLSAADPALRAGALGVLQALPEAVLPHLPALLADPDPDLRVLAAELARAQPPATATALLCARLEREEHPNACAALVEALAECGTPEALPALRALPARLPRDPFLPFAVAAAIARLGGEPG